MSRFWVGVWVAWFVGTLVTFGILEWMALKDPHDLHPPLTQVIKRFVPRFLIALVVFGFCGWFYDHLTP